MAGEQDILYEVKDQVAVIAVNRPDVMNAMTYRMRDDLIDMFARIRDDDNVRVVVLTGAGDRAFISGADIKELEEDAAPLERKDIMLAAHRLCRDIETLGKPVIAAVNGAALGGGLELAMACTFRVAAESARFGQPEITLGMIPGYGGTQRLPRLVGKGRALELLLFGKMINAQEAHGIGLINKVVPGPELMESVMEMAETLAKMPPLAVRFALEAVDRGLDMSLPRALSFEADMIFQVFSTEDAHEGLNAFIQKRKPAFKGK
jgi:enoyl-CoA hydratase